VRGLRVAAAWFVVLAAALFIAAVPVGLQITRGIPGEWLSGNVRVRWSFMWNNFRNYVKGFGNGESFRYYSGQYEYYFWEQIGDYFQTSLMYLSLGAVVGTTVGLVFGLIFTYSSNEWWKRGIEMTGALPDFVIILLLQYAIVEIAKETGIVVFKVANVTRGDEPAIILPVLSMIVIPALYIIRNVALQLRLTLTEDFIGTAKSKGLSKGYILVYHALPNVLPFMKADLHKFMGILLGNLFIVEYFYNIHGITKFLFHDAIGPRGYQYDLVANGILVLLSIYGLLFFIMRAYLFGWGKVVAR